MRTVVRPQGQEGLGKGGGKGAGPGKGAYGALASAPVQMSGGKGGAASYDGVPYAGPANSRDDEGASCFDGPGGLCVQPAGAVTQEHWRYVGEGRGGYAQVQEMNYVGQGAGSFNKDEQKAASSEGCPPCLPSIVVVLVLLIVAAGVRLVMTQRLGGLQLQKIHVQMPSWFEVPAIFGRHEQATSPPFVYQGGSLTTSAATSEQFDCVEGYFTWKYSWSPPQKAWCCQNFQRGCPETTGQDTYKCQAGNPSSWPLTQRQWCCKRFSIACSPSLPAATSDLFDCQAGFSNWAAGWSMNKKAWCCEHHHRGCPTTSPRPVHRTTGTTTTLTEHHDCAAGDPWADNWSIDKKVWCCMSVKRGCPTQPPSPHSTSLSFDCEAGYVRWQTGWSARKKAWCCQHAGRACSTSTYSFDCNAGLLRWRDGWSVAKQRWCCSHEGKGCAK
mmetsp:Transcript_109196/g.243664  ORF Transcript_109196/g.243664 Transcript_109196/m.243664 type:complete len:441 (+) Transcript_109196:49-1371(+)